MPLHIIVKKRSITLNGHKTAVSMEDEFWEYLRDMAEARDIPLSDLVWAIAIKRQQGQSISSACRVACLKEARR